MTGADPTQIHGTCVAVGGNGVLLLGDSGSGKSDLALRLIDGGAALVADDRVDLVREDLKLMAAVPEALAGRIEVRGVGIVQLPWLSPVPVVLAARLDSARGIERLPMPETVTFCGIDMPQLRLAPFEASAPAKLRIAAAAAAADSHADKTGAPRVETGALGDLKRKSDEQDG